MINRFWYHNKNNSFEEHQRILHESKIPKRNPGPSATKYDVNNFSNTGYKYSIGIRTRINQLNSEYNDKTGPAAYGDYKGFMVGFNGEAKSIGEKLHYDPSYRNKILGPGRYFK